MYGFIQSTITTPIALVSNSSTITFQNDMRTRSTQGCNGWLCHSEGSPLYKITKGGYYNINFTGTVFSGTAGAVAIGLYEDGVLIPSTVRIANIGVDGFATLSINYTDKVCCKANSTITVGSVPSIINITTGATVATQVPTINSAIFSITKLS